MTPLCTCGQPCTITVRRRYSFGTGPYEHVCSACAPAPSDSASWAAFYATAAAADVVRQADVDRTLGGAA